LNSFFQQVNASRSSEKFVKNNLKPSSPCKAAVFSSISIPFTTCDRNPNRKIPLVKTKLGKSPDRIFHSLAIYPILIQTTTSLALQRISLLNPAAAAAATIIGWLMSRVCERSTNQRMGDKTIVKHT
jgi:hypothetical protein